MSYIDKKIQEVVKEIIAKEFEEKRFKLKLTRPKPKFR